MVVWSTAVRLDNCDLGGWLGVNCQLTAVDCWHPVTWVTRRPVWKPLHPAPRRRRCVVSQVHRRLLCSDISVVVRRPEMGGGGKWAGSPRQCRRCLGWKRGRGRYAACLIFHKIMRRAGNYRFYHRDRSGQQAPACRVPSLMNRGDDSRPPPTPPPPPPGSYSSRRLVTKVRASPGAGREPQ